LQAKKRLGSYHKNISKLLRVEKKILWIRQCYAAADVGPRTRRAKKQRNWEANRPVETGAVRISVASFQIRNGEKLPFEIRKMPLNQVKNAKFGCCRQRRGKEVILKYISKILRLEKKTLRIRQCLCSCRCLAKS